MYEETELIAALQLGNLRRAHELLDQNPDTTTAGGDFLNTPLHIAAEKGYQDIVVSLLKRGAEVNARNRFKETPLHLAVMMGHSGIVSLLISHGADKHVLNERGENPFNQHIAIPSSATEQASHT